MARSLSVEEKSLVRLVTGHIREMTVMAGLTVTDAQIWRGLAAVTVCGACFGGLQVGLIGVVIGALVAVTGVFSALWVNRHRRDRVIEAQLPGFLEAIARGLRTGLQVGPATVEAVSSTAPPLRSEVELLATELERGKRSADVFGLWSRRHPYRGTDLAAAAMAFAATAGGARAQAIDGVAATLRDRTALNLEVRSLTSQARSSALMIALMPVGFMFLSTVTGDDTVGYLFTTRFGLVALGVGLTLDVIGALWMRRIINSGL